jgi:hypothetical protein
VKEKYDIEYEGWAPCAHDEGSVETARQFIDHVLAGMSKDYFGPTSGDNPIVGGELELLLWELNSLGGWPTTACTDDAIDAPHQSFACNMWVRIDATGEIAGKSIRSKIQGDTFLLAMCASVQYWREKYAELTQEVHSL